MSCVKCIKRIFCSDYKNTIIQEEEDEDEFIVTPKITKISKNDKNKNIPLTIDDISETSMFKKINEWSS